MQLKLSLAVVLLLGSLLTEPVFSCCLDRCLNERRSSEFSDGWRFLEMVGEERETSRLREVSERITALESGGLDLDSAPERIALQVALMDALALLEWLSARDAGADLPMYEWEYMQQHPHRELQRRKIQAALETRPGDPYLTNAMVSLQGFHPDFYREQLELAVRSHPECTRLREQLAHFLLLNAEFEAARSHIVVLLAGVPDDAEYEEVRMSWALNVLSWLQRHPNQCPGLLARVREEVGELLANRTPLPDEFPETLVNNRLQEFPELVEPFLKAMSDLLSQNACGPGTVRPVTAAMKVLGNLEFRPAILTPPFPSYVSGHAGFSGTAGAVLGTYFPDPARTLHEMAEEAAMSRLFGGIHYRFDNDDGLTLGRQVAREVLVRRAALDGEAAADVGSSSAERDDDKSGTRPHLDP